MESVSVADAKARLSEILAQIEGGAEIVITRRGRPVAKLSSIKRPRKPIDFKALDLLLSRQRVSRVPSARLIRKMRDERY
jgi:prevent-host-death family protein